ncbi:MAG: CDP-glucose 4,6-dehydratase [Planctomycetes bacterium]|nr:CDP-glucose 4,6-dehydratase [Planctomycetota bacterium]
MFQNTFKNKRVLVTGHTGFKGSWLCSWLIKLGAQVAGYSDKVQTSPSLFNKLALSEKLHHDFRGDIRDYETLKKSFEIFKPEIVIHLAAKALVRDCYDNPGDAYSTNIMGTFNTLDLIAKSPDVKSAVMITSDKCYENVEWEYGYREDDTLGGKDPYSASKACAEILFSAQFRSYLKSKPELQIATARAGNVIGGGDWAKDRIIPDCIRAWQKGETLNIRSPKATRPWQHVLEPLSGYLNLTSELYLRKPGLNGESFNFGPDADVNKTVEDMINEIKGIYPGAKVLMAENNDPKEASLLKLSCDKALNRLQWGATLNFEQTLDYTTSWYKTDEKQPDNLEAFTLKQIESYETVAQKRGHLWAQS